MTNDQDRLWRRFSIEPNQSAMCCACGASFTWSHTEDLEAWLDVHGPHMPPHPDEELKPEYGNLTTKTWGELRAKARELHAAVGTNPRWQYIAIEAFPELLEDNLVRLPRDEVVERLTDELVAVRRLKQVRGEVFEVLHKILDRIGQSSVSKDPDVCIEEVKRLALECLRGGHEPEGWWWLSFCDAARPNGEQFLGACLVKARGMLGAVSAAHSHGCNPGGEVRGMGPMPLETWLPDGCTERLLTKAECEEFDRVMKKRDAQ